MTSKRNKRSQTRSRTAETLRYSGPVRLPTRDGLDNRTTRLNASLVYDIVSNGSGNVLINYTTSPTATTDWSSVANLYQEYRVLGFEVKYVPYYNMAIGSTGTPIGTVGAMASTHTASTPNPSSLDDIVQNATWKEWHTHKPLTMHWKMRGTEEAQWSNVGTSVDHGSIVGALYFGDASANYGRVYATWLVELRGRK